MMASAYRTKIEPDVLDVLRRSNIAGGVVVLPEQLDRKLYQRVNKVLEAAGGAWARAAGGHVFPGTVNVREVLGLAMDQGEIQDERKLRQKFYTPPSLAEQVARLADVHGRIVLEPSAGDGALVRAVMAAGAQRVECVEQFPDDLDALKAVPGVRSVIVKDFLEFNGSKYSRVVMNPPYANDAAFQHVSKALMRHLSTAGGLLVAIVPNSTLLVKRIAAVATATNPDAEFETVKVPEGAFRESGTNVNVVIVVVKFSL